MFRFLAWFILWVVTLGMLDIDVKYSDGLSVHLVGWPKKLGELLRRKDE